MTLYTVTLYHVSEGIMKEILAEYSTKYDLPNRVEEESS